MGILCVHAYVRVLPQVILPSPEDLAELDVCQDMAENVYTKKGTC